MNETHNNNSTQNGMQGSFKMSDEEAPSQHAQHMTPRVKRVLEKANKISLTHEEKLHGASEFSKFMEKHPAGVASPAILGLLNPRRLKSPYFNSTTAFFASMNLKRKVLVPIAALLIFTLGIGTTNAASDALPGDVLYVVKTNINEKVESLLAINSEAKARVSASHAAKRLAEAEKLAEEGRLSDDVQAELEASFSEQAIEFVKNTETLRTEGNAEAVLAVSSEFETSLSEHQKSLAVFSATSSLNTVVKSHLAAASERRVAFEASVASTSATIQKRNSAQNALAVSKDKLKKVEGYISDAARSGSVVARAGKKASSTVPTVSAPAVAGAAGADATIESELAGVKKALNEGQSKFNTGAYSEAYLLFRKANEGADSINSALQIVTDKNKKRPLLNKGSQKKSLLVSTSTNANAGANVTSVQIATTSGTISSGAAVQAAASVSSEPAPAALAPAVVTPAALLPAIHAVPAVPSTGTAGKALGL